MGMTGPLRKLPDEQFNLLGLSRPPRERGPIAAFHKIPDTPHLELPEPLRQRSVPQAALRANEGCWRGERRALVC